MKASFFSKIDQFFFRKEDNLNLSFFRIGIAFAAIIILIAQYPDLLEIYGQYGYFRADIVELPLLSFEPRLSWMTDILVGLGVSELSSLNLVFWIYVMVLLMLAGGIAPTVLAVICIFFQLSFMNSGQYYAYGVDYFILAGLFYCFLFPVGHQLRLNIFKKSSRKEALIFYTRVLQIHLCLVYFISGFDKSLGYDWWNGEAIWTTLMGINFRVVDMGFLADFPFIPKILGWSVLLIEVGYPFFIFWKKTRYLCLGLTCLMHVGIGVFMGLYYFAFVMIIFNISAFGGELLKSIEVKGKINRVLHSFYLIFLRKEVNGS